MRRRRLLQLLKRLDGAVHFHVVHPDVRDRAAVARLQPSGGLQQRVLSPIGRRCRCRRQRRRRDVRPTPVDELHPGRRAIQIVVPRRRSRQRRRQWVQRLRLVRARPSVRPAVRADEERVAARSAECGPRELGVGARVGAVHAAVCARPSANVWHGRHSIVSRQLHRLMFWDRASSVLLAGRLHIRRGRMLQHYARAQQLIERVDTARVIGRRHAHHGHD